jgi:hypothetical protein
MTMELNWNLEDIADEKPLPEGVYKAVITYTEGKTTKAGGKMLAVRWEIIEGEHQGQRVGQNITLENTSVAAVDAGRRAIKNICQAVGIMSFLDDTLSLHDKPCMITVVQGKPYNGKTYPEVKSAAPIAKSATPSSATSWSKAK